MIEKQYVIEVHQGVEPVSHGPFQTEDECDDAAREIHKKQRPDDSLFWAVIDNAGGLAVGSYAAGFFMDE